MRRTVVLLALGLLLGACGGSSLASVRPTARSGAIEVARYAQVQSDILTDARGSAPDPGTGKQVVTYNGWPLYRYAADPQAGFASGQAVDSTGGEWYVMRPSGQPIVPAGYPQPVPSP